MVPFTRNGLEIFCEYEGMGKYLWYIDKKWENTCGECCFIKVGRLAIAFTKTFLAGVH